ncbi:MAG: DNA repair protein RecN, partial [Candidatus Enteromonas sp.]
VSTIILDEIDTGISGEAASKVADKIAEISLSTQVIAITHTPQVASRGDHHLLIEKAVSGGRTFASVKELGYEEKIKVIATLISGKNPTQKQFDAARDMVLSSR